MKYFGTDGFRGRANEELTAEHAFRIGRFWAAPHRAGGAGAHRQRYAPLVLHARIRARCGRRVVGCRCLSFACDDDGVRLLSRAGGRFRLRRHDLGEPQPV